MKAIAYFRSEHKAILAIANRLGKALDSHHRDQRHIDLIIRRTADLHMAIMLHVVVEDEDFYPRIARCGHPEVQQPIQQIKAEAGDIDAQFQLFLKKWGRNNRVQDHEQICQDARGLLSLLEKRIAVEEQIFHIIGELGLDLQALPGVGASLPKKLSSRPASIAR